MTMDANPTAVADGDLTEWGPLPAPVRPETVKPHREEERPIVLDRDPQIASLANPADAASRIAFALSSQNAWILGDLDPAASDGVWVHTGTQPAELPSMATAAEEAEHTARFERAYLIDASGIRVLGRDGALSPIEGAKAAWKPGAHRISMEVALPLTALPRAAESPVERVRLAARLGPSAPALPAEQWSVHDLRLSITFEPYGQLRALALSRSRDLDAGVSPNTPGFREPRGVSYQPGDPLHIEVVDAPDCKSIARHEIPLFEPFATFGDLGIVRVSVPRGRECKYAMEPWLATIEKDKVKSVFQQTGLLQKSLLRGDEMQVWSYEPTPEGAIPGTFRVEAISRDGAHQHIPVDIVPAYVPFIGRDIAHPTKWEDLEFFLGAEKDDFAFGWRGARGGRGFEATWRWDAAHRWYKGSQRFINLPVHKATKPPAADPILPIPKDTGRKVGGSPPLNTAPIPPSGK